MWTRLAFLLVVMGTVAPVRAAEPVFPTGLHIGLVPPSGMVPSTKFPGFEHPDKTLVIVIAEFPGTAFSEIEKGLDPDVLKAQGVAIETREPVARPELKGTLVVGTQDVQGIVVRRWLLVAQSAGISALVSVEAQKGASADALDATVRAALETVRVRDQVPSEELLALLPYALRDLAGFRIVQALPNGGALLTDGPSSTIELAEQPAILITIIPSVPDPGANRASFARMAISSIPGVKDMRIERMEPMRIGGQQGFELMVDGKEMKSETDLTVVQWLRFGVSSSLRMVAIARKDDWAKFFPRFRAVRDGLEPR